MTKVPRVEVITSVERRRRWSRSEKERLVAASFEDCVTASDIAREAGIHVSQLFRWRKELCQVATLAPEVTALVPVDVMSVPRAPDPSRPFHPHEHEFAASPGLSRSTLRAVLGCASTATSMPMRSVASSTS